MRYVMSDIHGDFKHFYEMLVKINFSSVDKLFILGDILDGEKDNICILEFIRSMTNICLIKGNHEYCCERYLDGTLDAYSWDVFRGRKTRNEVDMLSEERKQELKEYLHSLSCYKILDVFGKSYFLTHSGYSADFSVYSSKNLIDIEASVCAAVRENQEKYLISDDIHQVPNKLPFDKNIIVGHYPTIFLTRFGQARIFHHNKYIDVDTGNGQRDAGGRLSCLRLEDGKEYCERK